MRCCGAVNVNDFNNTLAWHRPNIDKYLLPITNKTIPKIPLSCCKLNNIDAFPFNLNGLQFVDTNSCLLNNGTSDQTYTEVRYALLSTLFEKKMLINIYFNY